MEMGGSPPPSSNLPVLRLASAERRLQNSHEPAFLSFSFLSILITARFIVVSRTLTSYAMILCNVSKSTNACAVAGYMESPLGSTKEIPYQWLYIHQRSQCVSQSTGHTGLS